MLSANVLRTFRKLSILTFWERYLLTLSGLSANVLLTLFCWVGTASSCTLETGQFEQVHLLMQRHKRKALAMVLCDDKGL